MIHNPKNGWCTFKLGDFIGHPSYLTNVPLEMLDAFIDYREKGVGAVVFDEEGAFFTLLMTDYNVGIFVIEEKDIPTLHDFSDMCQENLEKELIDDIERDLVGWAYFIPSDDEEELKVNREIIRQRLAKLKELREK